MQGLWKSSLLPYYKDSRRKKQKKRYFIKDKEALYYRSNSLRAERVFLRPTSLVREDKALIKIFGIRKYSIDSNSFVLNRPNQLFYNRLEFLPITKRYFSNRRKRFCKKLANRATRRNNKIYCKTTIDFYSSNPKTHDYSKSISWCID
jgi:hypothetical protein